MSPETTDTAVCPVCGGAIPTGRDECPKCCATDRDEWEKEGERLKKLWVMAAVFFWFSVIFQGVLFILDGTLNIVLLSVIGGTMVLGIVLKFRFQRHMQKNPPR